MGLIKFITNLFAAKPPKPPKPNVFCRDCKYYCRNDSRYKYDRDKRLRTGFYTFTDNIPELGGHVYHCEVARGYDPCLKNFRFKKLPDKVTPTCIERNRYTSTWFEVCERKNRKNQCEDFERKT